MDSLSQPGLQNHPLLWGYKLKGSSECWMQGEYGPTFQQYSYSRLAELVLGHIGPAPALHGQNFLVLEASMPPRMLDNCRLKTNGAVYMDHSGSRGKVVWYRSQDLFCPCTQFCNKSEFKSLTWRRSETKRYRRLVIQNGDTSVCQNSSDFRNECTPGGWIYSHAIVMTI